MVTDVKKAPAVHSVNMFKSSKAEGPPWSNICIIMSDSSGAFGGGATVTTSWPAEGAEICASG